MMWRALRIMVLLALTFSVGAAVTWAQGNGEHIFTPRWDTPAPVQRHFPTRALERGRGGEAILCCGPGAERGLSCTVTSETPRGFGFGDAAQRFVAGHRLTPESDAEFRASPANWIEIAVTFQVERSTRSASVGINDERACPAPARALSS